MDQQSNEYWRVKCHLIKALRQGTIVEWQNKDKIWGLCWPVPSENTSLEGSPSTGLHKVPEMRAGGVRE
jgi:hypothetical protein